MPKAAIIPASGEVLGLKPLPHPAFYSHLVADRDKVPLATPLACLVLDDFIDFAQAASEPEEQGRNSNAIQTAFSRVALFCERTPAAQQYVRRGFTPSDEPTDTIPQLAIPVVGASVLFERILGGELGNTAARRVNKLTVWGVGKKSLQLAHAAVRSVHTEHPDLLNVDPAAVLPAIGPPILDVGTPAFIEKVAEVLDVQASGRSLPF